MFQASFRPQRPGVLVATATLLTTLCAADATGSISRAPQLERAKADASELDVILHNFAHLEDRTWGPQVSTLLSDLQESLGAVDSRGDIAFDDSASPTAETFGGRGSSLHDVGRRGEKLAPDDRVKRHQVVAKKKYGTHSGERNTHVRDRSDVTRQQNKLEEERRDIDELKASMVPVVSKATVLLGRDESAGLASSSSSDGWDLEQLIDTPSDRRRRDLISRVRSGVSAMMHDMERIDRDKAKIDALERRGR